VLTGVALRAAPSSRHAFSDWDLYRFGLAVGARTLGAAPVQGLKRLILPEEYVRWAETRYVLQHLDAGPRDLVLDIGSPKMLSLFLAARVGARVHATDLLDYFVGPYGTYARQVLGADSDRYRMAVQDARALTYPAGTFDRVFSISTIEHIPDDGDSVAIREIARVLKPGGTACLTVPWSDDGYVDEFGPRTAEVYWTPADDPLVFYQRAYDMPTLTARLLEASGLDVVDVSFWGERQAPVEHLILHPRLPRVVRWAIYPAHFPLSRLFLRELSAEEPSWKKVACLTLRKPPCVASRASSG
jgi:SAM-dependent methyltransferase